MGRTIHKLSDVLDSVVKVIMASSFILAFVTTLYQVFSRYVLNSAFLGKIMPNIDFRAFNFTWTEELIRYLFVWIVFLGIASVYKTKGHAKVELLMNMVPVDWKRRLAILIEFINASLFILLMIVGINILATTSLQVSPSLNLNMSIMYVSIAISAAICFIHFLSHAVKLFTDNEWEDSLPETGIPPKDSTS